MATVPHKERGQNLKIVNERLIIRTSGGNEEVPIDSILAISFNKSGGGGGAPLLDTTITIADLGGGYGYDTGVIIAPGGAMADTQFDFEGTTYTIQGFVGVDFGGDGKGVVLLDLEGFYGDAVFEVNGVSYTGFLDGVGAPQNILVMPPPLDTDMAALVGQTVSFKIISMTPA